MYYLVISILIDYIYYITLIKSNNKQVLKCKINQNELEMNALCPCMQSFVENNKSSVEKPEEISILNKKVLDCLVTYGPTSIETFGSILSGAVLPEDDSNNNNNTIDNDTKATKLTTSKTAIKKERSKSPTNFGVVLGDSVSRIGEGVTESVSKIGIVFVEVIIWLLILFVDIIC